MTDPMKPTDAEVEAARWWLSQPLSGHACVTCAAWGDINVGCTRGILNGEFDERERQADPREFWCCWWEDYRGGISDE